MARRSYSDFSDFAAIGHYGAWYDAALDIARQVIPSKTVVGRLIGSPPPTPTAVAAPPPGAIAPTPTGGGMPSWVIPVAIGGGALFLFMMLKPRGRRR